MSSFSWKPAPDTIGYLLSAHNLDPREAAMAGDREIDLIRARAAGVHTIHYLCKEVPQALECNWRFSDDSDLAKALENACI